MKKLILLAITLYTSTTFTHNMKPKLKDIYINEVNGEITDKAIVTPAFQNPIHSSDLSASANPQYSIKSSGRYYLAENLTQEHNTAGGIILLINSNNTTLDMNSKSIEPHVSGSLSTGTGIAVAKGLSNITIMNGSINALDNSGTAKLNTGIDLSETAVSSGSGTSYSIKLLDLNITRCKFYGIDADTINDLSIENSSANDASGSSACRGAMLDTVSNLLIKNCEFNNNTSSGSYGEGLRLSSCTNGLIEDTKANSNSTTGGLGSSGIYVSGGSNLIFKNTNASSNTSSASSAYGIAVLNAPLINFKNCNSNNNNSSSGAAAGFYLSGSGTNCSLIKCQAKYNSSTSSSAYGVYLVQNTTYLEDVVANGNTTDQDAAAYGFYITRPDNNFVRCHASKNRNTNAGSSTSAHAYGFFISGGDRNQFTECTAVGNSTAANEAVRAVGFYTTGGNNQNRFEECKANANNASSNTEAVVAAGFQFNGVEARSQIINCEATNNLVGSSGGASVSTARAYGIYFDTAAGTDQCIVKDCYLAYNSVTTGGKAFGFYDNNTASTSLLTGNVAIGHGKSLGSTLDASMQWNSNSEPSASQNYFFKHTGTGDDPRAAIQEVPRENFASISTMVQKWQNISVYNS